MINTYAVYSKRVDSKIAWEIRPFVRPNPMCESKNLGTYYENRTDILPLVTFSWADK